MSRRKNNNPADEPKKQSLPEQNQHRKTVNKKPKSSEHLVSRWDTADDGDDDDLTLPRYGSFLNELEYDVDLDWGDDEESQQKEPPASAKKTSRRSRGRKGAKKHSEPVSPQAPPVQEQELLFEEDDDEDDLTLPSYGRSHRSEVSPEVAVPPRREEKKSAPRSSAKKSSQSAEKRPVERKSVERQKDSAVKKGTAAPQAQAQQSPRGDHVPNRQTKKQPVQEKKVADRSGRPVGKKEELKSQTAEKVDRKPDRKTEAKPSPQARDQQRRDKKPQKELTPEPKNSDRPAKTAAVQAGRPSREKEARPPVKADQKTTPPKEKQPQAKPKQDQKEPVDRKNHKSPKNPQAANASKTAFQFGSLKLSQKTLQALETAGYLEPTPVQEGVIPLVMQSKDVMGQARTGTGKTAAFLIPILEGLDECGEGTEPVALILVPTRELAVQVRDEGEKLAAGRDVRIMACYGGKPISDQIRKLKSGADIVVGTPGRILDLASRKVLSFSSLFWVVLDEADRMLDIGFRPDIEKILRQTPADRQTLLLSATLPSAVVKLAERYMQKPEVVDFSESQVSVETIEQFYITVDRERKYAALVQLLAQEMPQQAIIFCRTKRGVDRLYRLLEDKHKNIASLHSDMAQTVRDRVMAKFRSGKLQYLVATDVIGRGIDVTGISHIINYDIPSFSDDYVHRVGRTGRMGREGVAYTLVTAEEGAELTRIEMRINRLLKRAELKGFQAVMQVEKEEESLPAKPVFGKTTRRVRRAL